MSREGALLALKALAANAAKLAYDLEHGKLWEGEYPTAIAQLDRDLDAAKNAGIR